MAAAVLPIAVAGSDDATELAAMLALLVAACFGLARLLRLGWIADYFSRPVLMGYLHGIAITLVITQLPAARSRRRRQRPAPPPRRDGTRAGDVSGTTLAVGASSLGALLVIRRFVPFLLGALIVVVATIGLSWAVDLASHGVATVGPVASGLPRPSPPTPAIADVVALAPAAVGLFLVSFADEILTARASPGSAEPVRASQELVSMGVANLAAGFTQSFSVGARRRAPP